MRKISLLLGALLCLLHSMVWADPRPLGPVQTPPLIVEESDGSPSVKGTWKLILPNGSLTQSGGQGTISFSGGLGAGFTAGSILFSNGTSLAQDNANLFWDDTNNALGLWTASPTAGTFTLGESLGAELAPGGGTFTGSAAGWTLNTGWVYNSNAVDKNADGTGTLTPSPALSVTAGRLYKIVYVLSNWTVGTATPAIGGISGAASAAANGTYTQYILAGTTGNLTFTPTSTARFTI